MNELSISEKIFVSRLDEEEEWLLKIVGSGVKLPPLYNSCLSQYLDTLVEYGMIIWDYSITSKNNYVSITPLGLEVIKYLD